MYADTHTHKTHTHTQTHTQTDRQTDTLTHTHTRTRTHTHKNTHTQKHTHKHTHAHTHTHMMWCAFLYIVNEWSRVYPPKIAYINRNTMYCPITLLKHTSTIYGTHE